MSKKILKITPQINKSQEKLEIKKDLTRGAILILKKDEVKKAA